APRQQPRDVATGQRAQPAQHGAVGNRRHERQLADVRTGAVGAADANHHAHRAVPLLNHGTCIKPWNHNRWNHTNHKDTNHKNHKGTKDTKGTKKITKEENFFLVFFVSFVSLWFLCVSSWCRDFAVFVSWSLQFFVRHWCRRSAFCASWWFPTS